MYIRKLNYLVCDISLITYADLDNRHNSLTHLTYSLGATETATATEMGIQDLLSKVSQKSWVWVCGNFGELVSL